MLKTLHGTLFLSFAGRKTMFRLSSLYWLEKSVDTVDKSMLLQKMSFSELSVIREDIRVCSFRRIQKRIFDPRFAGFRGRKEREIRNWICNLCNNFATGKGPNLLQQKITALLFQVKNSTMKLSGLKIFREYEKN